MEKQKLISVIVPVYKVEKYLKRCIDSIIAQTYKNLEIILVDDGSPDKCPQICDSYADMDARIRVIHKQNGGPGPARNSGLDIARGDYIAFVDSDDYIDPEMYTIMAKYLDETEADIVFSGYTIVVSVKKELEHIYIKEPEKSGMVSSADAAALMIHPEGYFTAVWNKLYRRNAIFPNGKQFIPFNNMFGEDEDWLMKILMGTKYIYLEPKSFYMWWRRSDSISTNHLKSDIVSESMLTEYNLVKKELLLFENHGFFQKTIRARAWNTGMNLCDKFYNSGEIQKYKQIRLETKDYFTDWCEIYHPGFMGKMRRLVKNILMDLSFPVCTVKMLEKNRRE